MRIALASPTLTKTINEGLSQLEILAKEASEQKASIICFPESFIPGYPSTENKVEKATAYDLQNALQKASAIAAKNSITIILPMDWYEEDKFLNVAFVISAKGEVLASQINVLLSIKLPLFPTKSQ